MGFFTGDMHRLTDDFKALRPTVMPAVPRVLNRIYDKVNLLPFLVLWLRPLQDGRHGKVARWAPS